MLSININKQTYEVDVDGDTPLLWVLRDILHLNGTKYGCGVAACGACTILLDGVPVRSCVYPVSEVGTQSIVTLEGLRDLPEGQAVAEAWVEENVPQCGYCQSGQMIAASALLAVNPNPGREEIASGISNVCRCGTYPAIILGIQNASEKLSEKKEKND